MFLVHLQVLNTNTHKCGNPLGTRNVHLVQSTPKSQKLPHIPNQSPKIPQILQNTP